MTELTVRRAAESRNLIIADSVIALLGLTDDKEIAQVDRLTAALSRTVEQYCDRVFARELVTETFGLDDLDIGAMRDGAGATHRIVLTRRPVLIVEAMRYNGDEYDMANVKLEDSEAGFLFNAGGFTSTTLMYQQIETVRTRFRDPLWEVDYSAGYTLPSFPVAEESFSTGDVNTTTNKISKTGHKFVNGDTVRFTAGSGATLPGGIAEHRDYYVRSATASDFEIASKRNGGAVDITTVGSGTNTVTRQTTLPDDLQNELVQLVVSEFKARDRDRSIAQERLGDYQVQYANPTRLTMIGSAAFPPSTVARLERYREVAM